MKSNQTKESNFLKIKLPLLIAGLSFLLINVLNFDSKAIIPLITLISSISAFLYYYIDHYKEKVFNRDTKRTLPETIYVLFVFKANTAENKYYDDFKKVYSDQDAIIEHYAFDSTINIDILNQMLKRNTGGLIILWNKIFIEERVGFYEIMENWSLINKQIPIIILAKDENEKREIEKTTFNRLHIIDRSKINNPIPKLIHQALSRTSSFVKLYNRSIIWLYVCLSLLVIVSIFNIITYKYRVPYVGLNDLTTVTLPPKYNAEEYLGYKKKELSQIFDDENFKISYWQADSKINVDLVTKIYAPEFPENAFKKNGSFAGSACGKTEEIIGWLRPNPLNKSDTSYCWDIITGSRRENVKVDYNDKIWMDKKSCIMGFATFRTTLRDTNYKILCFISSSSKRLFNNIITNKPYNEIAKKEIVEMSYELARLNETPVK